MCLTRNLSLAACMAFAGAAHAADSFDAKLVGSWVQKDDQSKDLVSFNKDGLGREQYYINDKLFLDVETKATVEQGSPARMMESITKITYADSNVDVHVGQQVKCIYEVTDKQMKQECGDEFPSVFSNDAMIYTKQ